MTFYTSDNVLLPYTSIILVHVGSPPTSGSNALHRFCHRLLTGPELRPLCDALEDAYGADACLLRENALILLQPNLYEEAKAELAPKDLSGA